MFSNLDEETKEKAQDLIEETEAELAELGIDHLPFIQHNESFKDEGSLS